MASISLTISVISLLSVQSSVLTLFSVKATEYPLFFLKTVKSQRVSLIQNFDESVLAKKLKFKKLRFFNFILYYNFAWKISFSGALTTVLKPGI